MRGRWPSPFVILAEAGHILEREVAVGAPAVAGSPGHGPLGVYFRAAIS